MMILVFKKIIIITITFINTTIISHILSIIPDRLDTSPLTVLSIVPLDSLSENSLSYVNILSIIFSLKFL